jgi:HD-GYP domain-containing protein (c-di-GMP phosphodiesterase class II)
VRTLTQTQYYLATLTDHDPPTATHSWRVRGLSLRLARALHLSPALCHSISRGALLHDLGKVAIPVAVLIKREPPTPEDRALLVQHPLTGARLLDRAGLDTHALATVRHHHERWDGAGYPDGLARQTIPLSARIVAVADVYDALTAERPYRPKPFRPEDALAHLRVYAGAAFDPTVVLAFVALMTSQRHDNNLQPAGRTGIDVLSRAGGQFSGPEGSLDEPDAPPSRN